VTTLGDLTWPEARQRAAAGALLAVPVGSTEQHGPHLPLSTDTDVAVALAARLAARRDDVLVAPPVGYGSSGEHAGFAGTISIGQQALELVLVELGRSAGETFGHLLLISAHGGNAEPAARAVARLRAESRDVLLWAPGGAARAGGPREGAARHSGGPGGMPAERPQVSGPRVSGPQVSGPQVSGPQVSGPRVSGPMANGSSRPPAPDAHAGRTETAIQLALDPARVRAELAEAGNRAPVTELMPLLRAGGVRAASSNGVLGDPAGASAAEGEALLAALTADLLSAVAAWRGPVAG
jgi:creatinine amidohydrolase